MTSECCYLVLLMESFVNAGDQACVKIVTVQFFSSEKELYIFVFLSGQMVQCWFVYFRSLFGLAGVLHFLQSLSFIQKTAHVHHMFQMPLCCEQLR